MSHLQKSLLHRISSDIILSLRLTEEEWISRKLNLKKRAVDHQYQEVASQISTVVITVEVDKVEVIHQVKDSLL